MSSKNRGHISLTQDTFERLRARCQADGVSVSSVVERLCCEVMGEPPPVESLKRIAWAYGCARKGSDEERQLLAVLVERIQGGGE